MALPQERGRNAPPLMPASVLKGENSGPTQQAGSGDEGQCGHFHISPAAKSLPSTLLYQGC